MQMQKRKLNVSTGSICHDHFFATTLIFSAIFLVNYIIMSLAVSTFHSAGLAVLTFQDALLLLDQVLIVVYLVDEFSCQWISTSVLCNLPACELSVFHSVLDKLSFLLFAASLRRSGTIYAMFFIYESWHDVQSFLISWSRDHLFFFSGYCHWLLPFYWHTMLLTFWISASWNKNFLMFLNGNRELHLFGPSKYCPRLLTLQWKTMFLFFWMLASC